MITVTVHYQSLRDSHLSSEDGSVFPVGLGMSILTRAAAAFRTVCGSSRGNVYLSSKLVALCSLVVNKLPLERRPDIELATETYDTILLVILVAIDQLSDRNVLQLNIHHDSVAKGLRLRMKRRL